VIISSVLVLCGVVLAGCGDGRHPIVIGAAGPWERAVGAATKQGIELAVAEINAAGGVRHRPLSVIMRDDGGDGKRAAAIAQEFVRGDTVLGVIGHVNSGPTIAASTVYDGRLAVIATAATSPDLTGISPWVFRVVPSDSISGRELARFAAQLGRTRAAIIYENDSYGRGLAAAFRRAFNGVIVSQDPIAPDAEDLEPYVAYYKQRAPDVVFAVGGGISGLALLREARRQRLASDFIGGDGWTGVVTDTLASDGVYVGTPFTPGDPRPEVQRFVAAFQQRFNTVPDDKAALAYDATRLLARAIERGGASREAVQRYLAAAGDSAAYHGVTGVVRFGPSGDPEGKGVAMMRVRRGQFVLAGAR
jgi:branched-chain amino acid transport system substrate-binding protein